MNINIELLKTNPTYRRKVLKDLNGDMVKFWELMHRVLKS